MADVWITNVSHQKLTMTANIVLECKLDCHCGAEAAALPSLLHSSHWFTLSCAAAVLLSQRRRLSSRDAAESEKASRDASLALQAASRAVVADGKERGEEREKSSDSTDPPSS